MDIAIIIVSWNVKEHLQKCLHSIFTSEHSPSCEVYVVDNASSDGSAEMVATQFPQVHLMRNAINAGTSKAVNRAMKETKSRYVLWLNPDMRLFPDTLAHLVDYADTHTRAGVIGARLQQENGAIVPHVRRFPTLFDQMCIVFKLAKFFPKLLNNYLCADFDYSREALVDSIRGSFFCMRRECINEMGMFDERFFVWFEEVDFCKRAWNAGWEVHYTPRVMAIDLVGRSFAQVHVIKKQWLFLRSMVTYFLKHFLR